MTPRQEAGWPQGCTTFSLYHHCTQSSKFRLSWELSTHRQQWESGVTVGFSEGPGGPIPRGRGKASSCLPGMKSRINSAGPARLLTHTLLG